MTDANRCRNRKRQSSRQVWQPALFVLDEDGCGLPPWQPHGQVIAEAKDLVVPAFTDLYESQRLEIWMLFLKKRTDERLVDVYFSRRHWPSN